MAYKQAAELRAGADYKSHLNRLVNGLENLINGRPCDENTAWVEEKGEEIQKRKVTAKNKDIGSESKQLDKVIVEVWQVWLQTFKSPVSIISQMNLCTGETLILGLRLALLSYVLSFTLSLPILVLNYNLDIQNPLLIMIDLFITALTFILIGFCLHIASKIKRLP